MNKEDHSIQSTGPVVIAAMYKFVLLADVEYLQCPLLLHCKTRDIKGTILLAEEGINGTVAGSRESIDSLVDYLKSDQRFHHMEYKESFANKIPFRRMKVRLKKEIVTMGVPGTKPNETTGIHVGVDEWNVLVSDPEVTVIDARNQYECEIGTFKNAISPRNKTFRDFPEFVKQELDPGENRKIAMFCTGGIRCEKATSYMLGNGFNEVFQLNGGILRYLEEVEPGKSLWQGECFVFDERVAVNEHLEKGGYEQCFACRRPLSSEDRKSSKYKPGISCPYCVAEMTEERRTRFSERQRQIELANERNRQ